jgi:energy-coupling factor transport system permease protein
MPSGYSLYMERPSYLHQRLDPRTKTLILVTTFVLSLMFNAPLPLAVILGLLLATSRWAMMPWAIIRMLLLTGLWFVVLSVLIWPEYISQGQHIFKAFGFWITTDGILFGISMGLRITIMIFVASLWMFTTSPQKITASFLRMGLPYKAGMAVASTIRLIPLIAGEWATVVEAQRARGVDYKQGGLLQRAHKSTQILGPILLRSIDIAQSLAIAMESRAFGARKGRSSIVQVQMIRTDIVVMIVSVVLIGFGVFCRINDIGVLLPNYL